MSKRKCQIMYFHYEDKTFYAGDLVAGRVVLTLPRDTEYFEVVMIVKGTSICTWIEDSGNDKILYTSTQHLFRAERCLTRRTESSPLLTEGDHGYDFSFPLPHDVPSTFEGNRGKIFYSIEVIMKQTEKKVITNFDFIFNVKSIVNLRSVRNAMNAANHTFHHNFLLMFMNKGQFSMALELPSTGYVPKSNVPIKCTISNESKVNILSIKMILIQIVKYRSTLPVSIERSEILRLVEHEYSGVPRESTNNFIINNFFIPANCLPSTLNTCENIIISYKIKIKVKVTRLYKNLHFDIPITIGSQFINSSPPSPPLSLSPPPLSVSPSSSLTPPLSLSPTSMSSSRQWAAIRKPALPTIAESTGSLVEGSSE